MSGPPASGSGSTRAGRTVVSARALRSLAAGLAGESARTPIGDISVTVDDLEGALAVVVRLPFTDSPASGSFQDHGDRVRAAVITGLDRLAARTVHAVDVRFTGVRRPTRERVA